MIVWAAGSQLGPFLVDFGWGPLLLDPISRGIIQGILLVTHHAKFATIWRRTRDSARSGV